VTKREKGDRKRKKRKDEGIRVNYIEMGKIKAKKVHGK
jgi:hypothetical protein